MHLLPRPHLIHRYLSASANHSVRCFVSSLFLFHENPLVFRRGPELFTIFPFLYQAMEAGRIPQSHIHLLFPAAFVFVLLYLFLLLFPHLKHRYLLASAHHSVRCFVYSLSRSTKIDFSFGFGLGFSQSFHCSTTQWKLAAFCKAVYTSSLSLLLDVFDLVSAMNPSSNIAPAFANQSAFSLPSVTNFSNCDISFFCFFVRCACTCSTSTKIPFLLSHSILPTF